MKKLLFIVGLVLLVVFTIGAVQTYAIKPLGNCRKLDTAFTSPNGTHYQPYNCHGEVRYIVN